MDRLPDLAEELVRLKPDVIAHSGGPEGARALKQATSTIPIVLAAIEWDPVTGGVVAGIARPGTNFTGISALARELAAKRLELLKELVPRASRVAVLWHRPRAADQFRVLQEAAHTLKFNVVPLEMGALPHDLEGAFKTASREHADAVLVLGSPAFFSHRKRLAELALRHRLPTSFQRPAYAEAGGLMPRTLAMRVSGHKTEAVYRRYAIVTTDDVRAELERVQAAKKAPKAKVTALK